MSKLNLSIVAVVLSSIAIVLSIAQPTYDFLTTKNTESGKPSFSINALSFYVSFTFTRITITNNGTAPAHDVSVQLIFFAPALPNWEVTEFIPEIGVPEIGAHASNYVVIEAPIGRYQLESAVPEGDWFTNATSYEASVHITCKELESTTTFNFENFIT